MGFPACGQTSLTILGSSPAVPDWTQWMYYVVLNEQDFNITINTWDITHVGDYDVAF